MVVREFGRWDEADLAVQAAVVEPRRSYLKAVDDIGAPPASAGEAVVRSATRSLGFIVRRAPGGPSVVDVPWRADAMGGRMQPLSGDERVSDMSPPAAPAVGARRRHATASATDDVAPRVVGGGSIARAPRDAEFTAYFDESARRALARTAWLLTGDHHRAEELVQQALVKTYLAWPKAREGDPLAFARRVLANTRIDSWRRRRREVPWVSLPDHDAAGPDDHEAVDQRDQLVRALQQLGSSQRKIVVLRYLVGMSEGEVAEAVGLSVGTVKSQSHRGLARLRQLLPDAAATRSTRQEKNHDDSAR